MSFSSFLYRSGFTPLAVLLRRYKREPREGFIVSYLRFSAYRQLRLPTDTHRKTVSYIHCSVSNTNTATQQHTVEKEGFRARNFLIGQSSIRKNSLISGKFLVQPWKMSLQKFRQIRKKVLGTKSLSLQESPSAHPPHKMLEETQQNCNTVPDTGVHTLLELTSRGSSVSTSLPHLQRTKITLGTCILYSNSRAKQQCFHVFFPTCKVRKQYCNNIAVCLHLSPPRNARKSHSDMRTYSNSRANKQQCFHGFSHASNVRKQYCIHIAVLPHTPRHTCNVRKKYSDMHTLLEFTSIAATSSFVLPRLHSAKITLL